MNSPYEQVTCLASVELGWPVADCPGPEFSVSDLDPELRACVNCIALCMDKLRLEREDLQYDIVTGIPNRHAFEKTFTRMVQRGNKFVLMNCDIDGFKGVNDTLGHPQGDDVLRLFAQTLTDQLRPMDQVFRVGGDEFVAIIVSPEMTGDERENNIANRVEEAFVKEFKLAQYPADLKVGVSIGTGVYAGGDGSEFFALVDGRMYAHKTSKLQELPKEQSMELVDLREINSQAE